MRIDADCSETGWAEFGYLLPESLVFGPLVKGNVDSGNEIALSFDFRSFLRRRIVDSARNFSSSLVNQ